MAQNEAAKHKKRRAVDGCVHRRKGVQDRFHFWADFNARQEEHHGHHHGDGDACHPYKRLHVAVDAHAQSVSVSETKMAHNVFTQSSRTKASWAASMSIASTSSVEVPS